jgi:hypothetical protein
MLGRPVVYTADFAMTVLTEVVGEWMIILDCGLIDH